MVTRTFEQITFRWLTVSQWSDVPPANSVPVGTRITITNMLKSGGVSDWVTNGVRWTPIGGVLVLATLGTPVTLVPNVETIVMQTLIPAGAWQIADVLACWFSLTKSGATDTCDFTMRVGTKGDTTDAAITGINAASLLAAANQTGTFIERVKLSTATSAQKTGIPAATFGASNSAAQAATVIPSAAANNLFVSFSIASSGLNDTVGIQSAQLQLITP